MRRQDRERPHAARRTQHRSASPFAVRWVAAAGLASAAIACGNDEPLSADGVAPPVYDAGPTPDAAESHDAAPEAEAGPMSDGAPPVRTVETRNPFGNTAVTDNLLVDGDFELTSAGGQHGWRAMDPARGEVALLRETGGLCRSGVVCGVLDRNTSLIAFAAAPAREPVDVSLWVRPPGDQCDVVNATLISCMSLFPIMIARIDPVSPGPGEDGWCEYRGTSAPLEEQPCIFLQGGLSLEGRALVDQAVLVGAEQEASMTLSATVPTARELAAMHGALDWIHRHRRLAPPERSDTSLD